MSSSISNSSAISDCGSALASCSVTRNRLLHAVIALSILAGILIMLSLVFLLLLYLRLRPGREGQILVEEGTSTRVESVAERSGQGEKAEIGNIIINEEVPVLAYSLESPSSLPRLGVKDTTEDSRSIPTVPAVASVHVSSDAKHPHRPCSQPVEIAHGSQSHTSPPPSRAVVSVEDFDQGQDDEFHPEVRALVEEGGFTKQAVQRLKPVPPKAGTVIPDYNPILDEARPETMDEYINNYRVFFVIDDSGSMINHWDETRNALSEIADYALTYHSEAVDIRFFNSAYREWGVQGTYKVMSIFGSVSPSSGTPTGRVLREVLDEQLDRLDNAQRNGTYSAERPLEIIVLTDGVPNSDSPPAPVIQDAARRLKSTGHHQNWVSIQFVQIGDDPQASPTLLSLIDCANNNHMVDTISYSLYKDEGGGKLTPQILERIVLGGLHPNLRSYFNQYRRKLNARTSQVIY